MKTQKENIAVSMQNAGLIMRAQAGFGGMIASYNEYPKGTDASPLLEGLKNNSCQCPHWGYMIQGVMRIKYDDGTEEVLKAGDVFYLPAGHTGIIDEDTKVIEFNPEKEFGELGEHIAKKMAEMNG
jgi:hypothetical protein